jgi:hypothetical protein
MALHREIYWVGKQWAVTGHGIQACDQKQKAKFDIEASKIWDDGLVQNLRAEPWFNSEDFARALDVARARFPEQPREGRPSADKIWNLIEAVLKEADKKAARVKENPVESPKPATPGYEWRIEGCGARFVRQWRIRIRPR